jgi:hypothetical protein
MKTKTSNSKSVIAYPAASPPAEAGSPSRVWATAVGTARADVGMVSILTEDAVDAAFDGESFSFVAEASPVSESTAMVQSLSSQLAILESQCEQLRKILDTVTVNS